MSRLVASELLKVRTTRTIYGFLVAILALLLLPLVGELVTMSAGDLADEDEQRFLFGAPGTAGLFMLLVGILSVTGELRHGTMTQTLLVEPSRTRVVAAKIVATGIVAVAVAVLTIAVTLGVALPWLDAKGVALALSTRDLMLAMLGTGGGIVLFAAIGVGVGAAVRNQIAAVVGALVWVLVAESILIAVLPQVGKFTPGGAEAALTAAGGDDELFGPPAAALILAAYAVGFAALGVALLARRDVT